MRYDRPQEDLIYDIREGREVDPALVACSSCGRMFVPTGTDLAEASISEIEEEAPAIFCPTCRARDFED